MITSFNNARIKHLSELNTKSRTRKAEGVFVAEGFKMFLEAPVKLIEEIYIDSEVYDKLEERSSGTPSNVFDLSARKLADCRQKGISIETVSSEVFKKASDTETPQGIMVVLKRLEYTLKDICGGCVLILEDIQDPGNLGTMIRTGEGAGISGVLMSRGTVDIYNPKTIRSTMGSMFRVPFVYTDSIKDGIEALKKDGYCVYAAHLKGTEDYSSIKYPPRTAFMIGNEGNGLKDETASLADKYIRIPMSGELESLNASVAAALLMYESRRG